jgi:hypothetical protein
MEDRSSTGRVLEVAQLYETTLVDNVSNLSAHFVVVPTRSMAKGSYFAPTPPLEALGLMPLADVPLGGVVRSLAACLRAEDVEEFLQIFDAGFEEELTQRIVHPPEYLAFAEYLTFARIVPFEESTLSADSLGNILTAQFHGMAQFVDYEAGEHTPLLFVAVPAGLVICGATTGVAKALEKGLRGRVLRLLEKRSDEERGDDQHRGAVH